MNCLDKNLIEYYMKMTLERLILRLYLFNKF